MFGDKCAAPLERAAFVGGAPNCLGLLLNAGILAAACSVWPPSAERAAWGPHQEAGNHIQKALFDVCADLAMDI